MSFDNTMQNILPPINGVGPKITGNYGERREAAPDGRKTGAHGGVDFRYAGGSSNEQNSANPTFYSPVVGVVSAVVSGSGTYNTIKIKDKNGNSHEFLHSKDQVVKAGDSVKTEVV